MTEKLTAADWQSGYDVGDACNPSGVLHSLMKLLPKIRDDGGLHGHPLAKAYLYQIAFLVFEKEPWTLSTLYGDALSVCRKKAAELREAEKLAPV